MPGGLIAVPPLVAPVPNWQCREKMNVVYTLLVPCLQDPSPEAQIRQFFVVLYQAWGRQHWWPAQSRFEVVVGAFLTQNTAWTNVEKALSSLRRAGILSLDGIRRTPLPRLARLIRSAGYFRQKAQRLKNFVDHLDAQHGGSLDRMFARPTRELRQELLSLNGVGPETADSILLYAGKHPVFVVDAYTRRILARHGIVPPTAEYDEVRELFERALAQVHLCEVTAPSASAGADALPRDSVHRPSRMSSINRSGPAHVYNEMHGLIVGVGKNFCQKSRALCERCPLAPLLSNGSPRLLENAKIKGANPPGRRRPGHGK